MIRFKQLLEYGDESPWKRDFANKEDNGTGAIMFNLTLSWKEVGIRSSEFDVRPMTEDEFFD